MSAGTAIEWTEVTWKQLVRSRVRDQPSQRADHPGGHVLAAEPAPAPGPRSRAWIWLGSAG